MAYTVKQVAALSGVSVRTLHFYDETDLLKPAYTGSNGYRFYEEPQLLALQQIMFYRELGIALQQIRTLLAKPDFQRGDALRSHRTALEERLARTRRLLVTIDHTLNHLEGNHPMKEEQIFAGFTVAAGEDRFGERTRLGGEPNDCKVGAADTNGAMSIFEFRGRNGGGPRHSHDDQDEWLYVVDGEIACEVGEQRKRLSAGESVFLPRTVAHTWAARGDRPATVLDLYQPAGRIEQFFREVGQYTDPPIHEAISIPEMKQLFVAHGLRLLGPGLGWTD